MLCPACNTEIAADAAFCPKCGKQLTSAPAVAPAAADKFKAAQVATSAHSEPEHELWQGSFSGKAMYGSWILAAIVSVAAVIAAIVVPNPIAWLVAAVVVPVAWLIPAFTLWARRLGVKYTLTTQRFLHQRGVLRRVADQILLVDIDDISYVQGILGRIFNFGTIKLLSNDASDKNLVLVPIDDVQRVANLIDEARREERRKRAIYMANA
jgi:membrane protein YdbS with pleckstrin-like domain